jgi:nucleoside-diphosphate-sugar epimerase
MIIGIWGSGLIGKSLATSLVGNGFSVLILSRSLESSHVFSGATLQKRLMSFSNTESEMVKSLEGISVLIHCAGSANDDFAEFELAANRLAKAAIRANVFRVIMISTVAVYGDDLGKLAQLSGPIGISTSLQPKPMTDYAQSRYSAECGMRNILTNTGVEFVVVRIPMVIGQDMVSDLFKRLDRVLKFGYFPVLGSPTASLPCICLGKLVNNLTLLINEVKLDKNVYQFSQCLLWSTIIESYTKINNKNICLISFPGKLIFHVVNFLGFLRLKNILKILINETVFLDDSSMLLGLGKKTSSITYLYPDDDLHKILWS